MNKGSGISQKRLARLGDAAPVSLGRLASDCGNRHPTAREASPPLRDDQREARSAASNGPEERFGRLDGLARLGVAISWATSDDVGLRLAAARALGGTTRVIGLVSMLDQLTRDPEPQVRHAACVGCATWIELHPGSLAELLSLCAEDKYASIRAVAVEGLRAATTGPASRAAAEALVELARSRDRSVAEAACVALAGGRAE